MKYLVVVKETHYPSVFEFDNKEEAEEKFNSFSKFDLTNNDIKVYFCKIEKEVGDMTQNVSWL